MFSPLKKINILSRRIMRICFYSSATETFDNNEFWKLFKNFNITATEQDIDEFVAIDNETTHVFQEEILEETNLFFRTASSKSR